MKKQILSIKMFIQKQNNYNNLTYCEYTVEKKRMFTIPHHVVRVILLLAVLYVNDLKQLSQEKQVSKLDIVHFKKEVNAYLLYV
jgi:hypothetical protein